MLPSPETVNARQASLGRAATMLEIHVPDGDGSCAGCAGTGGRTVPAGTCAQRARARSVIETLGVEEGAWDAPVAMRVPALV